MAAIHYSDYDFFMIMQQASALEFPAEIRYFLQGTH